MRIMQFQTNFSVGELDPLIRARTDLQQYKNGLEEATNIIIQPQGGFRRRDGSKFIHDFGSGFTDFKVIPFEFSVDDSYFLVLVTQQPSLLVRLVLSRWAVSMLLCIAVVWGRRTLCYLPSVARPLGTRHCSATVSCVLHRRKMPWIGLSLGT